MRINTEMFADLRSKKSSVEQPISPPIGPLALAGIIRVNDPKTVFGSKVIYLFPDQMEDESQPSLQLNVYGLRMPMNGDQLMRQLIQAIDKKLKPEELVVSIVDLFLGYKSQPQECERIFRLCGLANSIIFQEVNGKIVPRLCTVTIDNRQKFHPSIYDCLDGHEFERGTGVIVAIRT